MPLIDFGAWWRRQRWKVPRGALCDGLSLGPAPTCLRGLAQLSLLMAPASVLFPQG